MWVEGNRLRSRNGPRTVPQTITVTITRTVLGRSKAVGTADPILCQEFGILICFSSVRLVMANSIGLTELHVSKLQHPASSMSAVSLFLLKVLPPYFEVP